MEVDRRQKESIENIAHGTHPTRSHPPANPSSSERLISKDNRDIVDTRSSNKKILSDRQSGLRRRGLRRRSGRRVVRTIALLAVVARLGGIVRKGPFHWTQYPMETGSRQDSGSPGHQRTSVVRPQHQWGRGGWTRVDKVTVELEA